jgi:hypothetical protein
LCPCEGARPLRELSAIRAHAKINAQGQWVDRSEHIDLNARFERMSEDELERYARDGKLPDSLTETVSVPLATGQDDGEEGQGGRKSGKHKNQLTLPATNSGPRPGDFPLGSGERVAVRAQLANQPDEVFCIACSLDGLPTAYGSEDDQDLEQINGYLKYWYLGHSRREHEKVGARFAGGA